MHKFAPVPYCVQQVSGGPALHGAHSDRVQALLCHVHAASLLARHVYHCFCLEAAAKPLYGNG